MLACIGWWRSKFVRNLSPVCSRDSLFLRSLGPFDCVNAGQADGFISVVIEGFCLLAWGLSENHYLLKFVICTSKLQVCNVIDCLFIPTDQESAETVEPTVGTFDHPSSRLASSFA